MRQIQRSIAECISRADFVSVGPDDPVSTAVAGMRDKRLRAALVIAEGKLIGIFTERDFLHRIASERRDPATVKVGDVMTRDPEALRAHHCITYAINRMALGHFRHVPIVDRHRQPTSLLDLRVVMMHLIKVFAEVEQGRSVQQEFDLGGGG